MTEHIELNRIGGNVAEIVLNRPEKHNAISRDMVLGMNWTRRSVLLNLNAAQRTVGASSARYVFLANVQTSW